VKPVSACFRKVSAALPRLFRAASAMFPRFRKLPLFFRCLFRLYSPHVSSVSYLRFPHASSFRFRPALSSASFLALSRAFDAGNHSPCRHLACRPCSAWAGPHWPSDRKQKHESGAAPLPPPATTPNSDRAASAHSAPIRARYYSAWFLQAFTIFRISVSTCFRSLPSWFPRFLRTPLRLSRGGNPSPGRAQDMHRVCLCMFQLQRTACQKGVKTRCAERVMT
jgi:hypothetical protein